MKLEIKNVGEFKVKVSQRGRETGTPDTSDYDNGIVEKFVQPGETITVEGDFWSVEYTPAGEVPEIGSSLG